MINYSLQGFSITVCAKAMAQWGSSYHYNTYLILPIILSILAQLLLNTLFLSANRVWFLSIFFPSKQFEYNMYFSVHVVLTLCTSTSYYLGHMLNQIVLFLLLDSGSWSVKKVKVFKMAVKTLPKHYMVSLYVIWPWEKSLELFI